MTGYKGIDLQIEGRPLIAHVVERFQALDDLFGDVYVAGPRRLYGQIPLPVTIIDTDGGFGDNIRVGLEAVRSRHRGARIAVTTCDILPEIAELRRLVANYRSQGEVDLWFPVIRAPEDDRELGAFGWKPHYRLVVAPGEEPTSILPGHLAIGDPRALRRRFFYGLMQVAYRTRNRSISYRRKRVVAQLILGLIYKDLMNLLAFRWPRVTWTVVRAGWSAAEKLRSGTIEVSELEHAGELMLIHARHQKRYPERGVRIPVVDAISLAEDIDTEEEARQFGAAPSVEPDLETESR